MTVFLNGEFIREAEARVSVFDRGFLYGDGLFETILVRRGNPFRWQQHIDRLQRGAEFLKLRLPFSSEQLREFAGGLAERNEQSDAILRIHLSRGVGPRGYLPDNSQSPTLVMSLHPAPLLDSGRPPRWKLITSSLRVLDDDPVAYCKTSNKLRHVLARMEAGERGADEALLLNAKGEVAEAASANVFWVDQGRLHTPPLSAGALGGVTREEVVELARSANIQVEEATTTTARLIHAEGVFLTLTSLGIVEVVELDGSQLRQSPMVAQLHPALMRQIELETV